MFLTPLYPFILFHFKTSHNLADAQLGILIASCASEWCIWSFKTTKMMFLAMYGKKS